MESTLAKQHFVSDAEADQHGIAALKDQYHPDLGGSQRIIRHLADNRRSRLLSQKALLGQAL